MNSNKKGRKSRRGFRKNGGLQLAPLMTTSSRRSQMRVTYCEDRIITLKPQELRIVDFSLADLLDKQGKSLPDWFEEFKITRAELSAINVNADFQGSVNVFCIPEQSTQSPTNFSEFLRCSGLRFMTASTTFFRPRAIGRLRPTFDTTGSSNQYRNDWLVTNRTGSSAKWYGFVLSQDNTSNEDLSLTILLKVWVSYRGYQ